jgi:hypothetical protein
LIIQVTVLQEFVELGSMSDDIDLLPAANIITGLQQLNAIVWANRDQPP